ncbi:MAG: HD domain-containing protein [Pseudobdellovibrionaceae bacterium]
MALPVSSLLSDLPQVPAPHHDSLTRLIELWRDVAQHETVSTSWHDNMAALFMGWRNNPETVPSLPNLIKAGAHVFVRNAPASPQDISEGFADWDMAMSVAHLCDHPQDAPYHSHHHTREVLVMGISLALHEARLEGLNFSQFLKVATGACLHDIGHPGGNNGSGEDHIPFLLEHRSFETIASQLPETLTEGFAPFKVMNSFTDFSKAYSRPDLFSPAQLLRAAFNAKSDDELFFLQHYHGANFSLISPAFNLASFIKSNWGKPTLLLAEADISPSASLGIDFSRLMTHYVSEEVPAIPDSPKSAYGFLKFACNGMFISKAAQSLVAPALNRCIHNLEQVIESSPTSGTAPT